MAGIEDYFAIHRRQCIRIDGSEVIGEWIAGNNLRMIAAPVRNDQIVGVQQQTARRSMLEVSGRGHSSLSSSY